MTPDNAHKIKARVIAETTNGPTMPGAEEILLKEWRLVLPDTHLNAGGVTVFYF